MTKRIVCICLACVLLLGCLAACGSGDENAVSVQRVSMICGLDGAGLYNRYPGLVVSGETAEIKKDSNKKVLETYVEVGDWVSEGDVIFCYDNQAMELELNKMLLELEGFENTIIAAEEQIPELEKAQNSVGAGQQLQYSLQIQSLQADIREATYNKGLKEREIAAMEEALKDTDVRAPIAGRVMSVQEEDASGGMGYGEADVYGGMGSGTSDAYITIMDMTTYQVKGNINELNLGSLMEGMEVIIRSRADESAFWTGRVDSIDWENPVTGNENGYYYYGPSDEMTSSSKYPFYVVLDDVTGLILGQHVYVEPNLGQSETKEGLWLPEYYICDRDSAPYVWAANSRSKLEKCGVELGEYDEEAGLCQILSGITADSYIAFPAEELTAGLATVEYDESSFGVDMGGEYMAEGMMEDAMMEDAMMEDAMMEDAMMETSPYEMEDIAEIEPGVEGAVG